MTANRRERKGFSKRFFLPVNDDNPDRWGPFNPFIPFGGKAKNIIDLQPFSRTSSITVKNSKGQEGLATLINLDPQVNAWYLLQVAWKGSVSEQTFHLENANPMTRTLSLNCHYPSGLVIAQGDEMSPCELWGKKSSDLLREARATRRPYVLLCDSKFYLRNPTEGHQILSKK